MLFVRWPRSFTTLESVKDALEKLKKLRRKTEKKYRHLKLLEEKRKGGKKLEKNQIEQLDSGLKYQLEKELRNYDERRYDVLRSASEKVREQFGACGNCASSFPQYKRLSAVKKGDEKD